MKEISFHFLMVCLFCNLPLTVKYDSSHELVPELVFPPGPGLCECQIRDNIKQIISGQSDDSCRLLTLDVSLSYPQAINALGVIM